MAQILSQTLIRQHTWCPLKAYTVIFSFWEKNRKKSQFFKCWHKSCMKFYFQIHLLTNMSTCSQQTPSQIKVHYVIYLFKWKIKSIKNSNLKKIRQNSNYWTYFLRQCYGHRKQVVKKINKMSVDESNCITGISLRILVQCIMRTNESGIEYNIRTLPPPVTKLHVTSDQCTCAHSSRAFKCLQRPGSLVLCLSK